jgi:hypothetical protein
MSAESFSPGLPIIGANLPTLHELDAFGSESGSNTPLIAWALSEAYSITAATRDSDGVITTATISWPDGSAGIFTTVTKNATFLTIDAYTVTHTNTGKTVTQAAVTRDASGNVTAQPAITIS